MNVLMASAGYRTAQITIHVGSQIPEKLPAVPDFPDLIQVKVCRDDLILVLASLDKYFPAGVHEIARAVKSAEFPGFFQPNAIIGTNKNTVGDRLGRLLKLPQILGFTSRSGRRIEQNFGAFQGQDPGTFGKMAVITDVDS